MSLVNVKVRRDKSDRTINVYEHVFVKFTIVSEGFDIERALFAASDPRIDALTNRYGKAQ
jgi:vancomycin permeability regulator SanA